MSGYSWISGISIFCYLFLLLSFLSSKKTAGVIKSFEVLLVIMILWTGGSAGMRLQFWPGVNFWHHVSLLGMMLLILGFFPTLLLLVCVGIGALIGGVPPVRSWITGQITKWLDKLINKF